MYICYVLTYRRLISVSISFRNFFFQGNQKRKQYKKLQFYVVFLH